MLLQIDGSEHKWLEDRGPYLTLVGAIDDATGKVPYALFREEEDSYGYFLLFREIVLRYGIPHAAYHDRHSIFQTSPRERESLEEQLDGKRRPTQFGRLLEELGITSIASLSPQARGRIERLWGTFQDRLVSELRLAGASSLEEANRVLMDFLPGSNRHFAVAAAEPGLAYRQLKEGFVPDEVFCFKHQRMVGADNVVRFGKHRLQIVPCNGRASYPRCRVEVPERLDGSLAVYYQGKHLTTSLTRPEPMVLRAQAKLLEPVTTVAASPVVFHHKPAPDHPWRLWLYRTNKE